MSTIETILSTSGFGLAGAGGYEWIIVLVIILVIFGPKKLPQLSRAVGKSITDFKRGLNDVKGDIEKAGEEAEKADKEAKAKAAAAAKEKKAEDWREDPTDDADTKA